MPFAAVGWAAGFAHVSCGTGCLDVAIGYRVTMVRTLDVAPADLADESAEICVHDSCESGPAPAPDGKPVSSAYRALLTATRTSDGRTELRVEMHVFEREAPTPIEVHLARRAGGRVTASGVVHWRDRDQCHTEPVRREI